MTELGNRLKEARNEKGLSLDDLQSITKIQKRYLIGIEEGNYSSMPGNFYVRAFIKQYAESLGLNPDELFEIYKSEIPVNHKDDIPQQLSRVKTHKGITGGSSKVFDILPKILIGVFILGVAGLLYVFLYKHGPTDPNDAVSKDNAPVKYVKSGNLDADKGTESNEKNTDQEQKEDSTDTAQTDDTSKQDEEAPVVETPQQELKVVKTSGRDSTYSLNNAEQFVVKLVSTGKTWVSIKNGKGRSFFQGTLATGAVENHSVDLTAESEAVIRVGNAAETEIYVNDQKLEYASTAKDVQNITIQYVPKNE